MHRPHRNRSLVYALYLNAAFLLAILTALLSRGNGTLLPMANAGPAPQTMAGGNGLYVMPAQILNNIYGCYVLDTNHQTLCVYQYKPGVNEGLRLLASRGLTWDVALTNNNTTPDPDEIRKLVQIGQQPLRGIRPQQPPAQNPAGPADPGTGKPDPQADTQPQTPNKEPAP